MKEASDIKFSKLNLCIYQIHIIDVASKHKKALAKLMMKDVDEEAIAKDVLEWADENLSTGDKLIDW